MKRSAGILDNPRRSCDGRTRSECLLGQLRRLWTPEELRFYLAWCTIETLKKTNTNFCSEDAHHPCTVGDRKEVGVGDEFARGFIHSRRAFAHAVVMAERDGAGVKTPRGENRSAENGDLFFVVIDVYFAHLLHVWVLERAHRPFCVSSVEKMNLAVTKTQQ